MDVSEAIDSRIEIRSYSDESIDDNSVGKILKAGQAAPSGRNLQHWRFILIDDKERLAGLADRSPTGTWIAGADFAVVICTDPSWDFHEIDAGRAVTHMQLTAWEEGVGSCIYTVDTDTAPAYLDIPDDYQLALVVGFGYPQDDVHGNKDRNPLSDIAYHNSFGEPLDPSKFQ